MYTNLQIPYLWYFTKNLSFLNFSIAMIQGYNDSATSNILRQQYK